MTYTLKLNARNDVHLPAEVLRSLNLGDDKVLRAMVKGNTLVLVPVDLEPRYSHQELDALNKLHADEKKKGFTQLKSDKDIDRLLD